MLFSTKLSVVAAFAAVANAQLTVNTPVSPFSTLLFHCFVHTIHHFKC